MHIFKDVEDEPPMNNIQKKFLVHVSVSFLIAILFGCAVGFVAGQKFFKATHVCPKVEHQIGYSIIDSNTIKTCCGKTERYHLE